MRLIFFIKIGVLVGVLVFFVTKNVDPHLAMLKEEGIKSCINYSVNPVLPINKVSLKSF